MDICFNWPGEVFSVECDKNHILRGLLPSKDRIKAVIFKTYCLFNPTFF